MAYNSSLDSDYSVRLAILGEYGGDTTKKYDSTYAVDLAILAAIQGGGGGGAAIDDNNVSTGTTYSSNKITQLLADAGFDVSIAQSLPASGDAHTIFFIPSSDPQTQNVYDEYLYVGNAWEQIGSTAIDLSNYATKNDISTFVEVVELTQDEYDALSTASKNNGKLYSITDAVVVDPDDYYTKTQADAKYNPLATVSASTTGYKFPTWNIHGQITGQSAQAYQASQNVNGASRTIYSTSATALPTIYAPTSAGTSGQYLVSSGSGAPTWQALEVASDYVIDDADASAGTYSTAIANFYNKTISENVTQGVQIKITDTHEVTPASYNVSTGFDGNLYDGSLFAVEAGQTAELKI